MFLLTKELIKVHETNARDQSINSHTSSSSLPLMALFRWWHKSTSNTGGKSRAIVAETIADVASGDDGVAFDDDHRLNLSSSTSSPCLSAVLGTPSVADRRILRRSRKTSSATVVPAAAIPAAESSAIASDLRYFARLFVNCSCF
ncbi:unnamed protein product [Soboliphyme baturini]|uniref:Secreted protein n=1 Tax=Soboliphyme baturini TaxID=241478 RepID=A0A183J0L2_9BILA|nr:unnamed protein product [Soboliphyme baturini]